MNAPTHWRGVLRFIGPGLILTASIVGSGELIVTPKLGGEIGFRLLWLILLGCVIKVFVQVELGRFAVSKGMTTLEALDSVPGPRLIVSWLLWLWLFMFVANVFQVAGIVGGIAEIFSSAGVRWGNKWLAVLVGASCALLLVIGRYRLVEILSMLMVVLFTVCTIIAVGTLQWTPYHISAVDILSGLKFQFPEKFTTAFACFGIIGVGASELIYYPYWCLEKGYARHVGPKEDNVAWVRRARGWMRVMRVDAWISMVIYTGATVAFYLLGAAVLHSQSLKVTDKGLIDTLAHLYLDSFGPWSFWIFLFGAFNVLYSTVFVATASNARLLVDGASLFRVLRYPTEAARAKALRFCCVLLPCISTGLYMIWEKPVSLVFVGALGQGLMLPFLGLAAVYFRYRRTDLQLRPGLAWTFCLWLAALTMGAVGVYQVVEQIQNVIR